MPVLHETGARPRQVQLSRRRIAAAVALACAPFAADAQLKPPRDKAVALDEVVVTATRVPEGSFDLPVSIDRVDRSVIREDRPQVNLSESLSRVPGVVVQNRQNYAQDLQISSRGFGGRSTFGVRGIRLYADGIPATMPDGQGQAATFNLEFRGPDRGAARPLLQHVRQRRRRRDPDLHRGRPARADAVGRPLRRQLRHVEGEHAVRRHQRTG